MAKFIQKTFKVRQILPEFQVWQSYAYKSYFKMDKNDLYLTRCNKKWFLSSRLRT